jgi:glycosyltransferase involved in cell wall biosynthesis
MYSGGQGVYLQHITRELAALGNEVHVIAGPPYPQLADGIALHRVPTYSIYRLLETGRHFFYGRDPLSFFHPLNFYEIATSRFGMFSVMNAFSFRAYDTLCALAEEHQFEMIHDVQGLGYGILLLKANALPVVANIHHPLQVDRANSIRQGRGLGGKVQWAKFYPFWMQELVARRIDRVITGSAASARSVAQEFRLPRERIAVIYDGVDIDAFRPLEAAKEPNSILYVGNSDDRNKGARYLIEALALLKAQGSEARVTVVDRPTAQTVPTLARQLGIEDRVELTGRLSHEELLQRYNSAEVFVSPSLYEGFGLPAAEAMACGAAVVATTAGAFPDVIEDGVSGLLVPPEDAHALADAISRLLADSSLRRELGRRARQRIVERFSWRETAVQTLALYQNVRAARAK